MSASTPRGLFAGLVTLDVVQVVDQLPGPNEKVAAKRSWLAVGGPAAVAAVTFARLGGTASLLTGLGQGPAADVVRTELAAAGVTLVDAAPPDFTLAPSVALVDAATGERAVVSGSAHHPEALAVPPLGPDPAVVLVDGHHAALARAAARRAASAGVPLVVDAGSHKPVFDEVCPHAAAVICSADYVHPRRAHPSGLVADGVALVAITHGPDPVEWWTRRDHGTVPVPAVTAVNTLGAGDVFHGAYCHAVAAGAEPVAALASAAAAASAHVARPKRP